MSKTRHLRRGIYLLPTVFTVGNLFCGFLSVIAASRGDTTKAALLIIVAGILDGLDGRIARLTGTNTEFGLQFDSLADIISFGIAPATLAYFWALEPFGRFGVPLAFIFLSCAAMRLARFNIQTSRVDKRYFAGMPSPPAAGMMACVAFTVPEPPAVPWVGIALGLLVVMLALLMISRFRYRSFKELDLRNRRSYIYVLPVAAMIAAIAIVPRYALLSIAGGYLLSAPVAYLWGLLRRLGSHDQVAGDTEVANDPAG